MRTTRRSRLRFATILFAFALLSQGLAVAEAVAADAFFRGFEPSGDFIVAIDGKELPKLEIYRSEAARSLLLIGSELASPVLVDLGAMAAESLDLMKVSKQIDGTVDVLADATLSPLGKARQDGAELVVALGAKEMRIRQRPFQLGPKSGAELLESNAGYRWTANRFTPDATAMKRLKGQRKPVRVLTFFGSWCSHCKRHLPLLLKVEQGLQGGKIKFDYYGLPNGFGDEPEAKKYGINGVPTAILFEGDQEIGRVPASQWSSPELALDLLLNGPPKTN